MLELVENDIRITLDATADEVIKAIEYLKHQRKLQHEKYRRLYKPNGNPPGRPKKNPPAEDKPKRPRGRPRKNPPPADE